jgi:putative Mg2+ transporter-C (MgtC) family protein
MNQLTAHFWTSIGIAVLCGGIIGLERQIRGKPAGIRTNILICLGTAIFVQLSTTLAGPTVDPTRVLGQVVTGIGFLGAGVILSRGGHIKGVTSAAVIWTLAGIGAMIGLGRFVPAIVLSLIVMCILSGIEVLEQRVPQLHGEEHVSEREK